MLDCFHLSRNDSRQEIQVVGSKISQPVASKQIVQRHLQSNFYLKIVLIADLTLYLLPRKAHVTLGLTSWLIDGAAVHELTQLPHQITCLRPAAA